jgi:hypothetical protein
MVLLVAALPGSTAVVLPVEVQVMEHRLTSKSREVLVVRHLALDMDLLLVVVQAMVVLHHLVLDMALLAEDLLATVVHHLVVLLVEAGAVRQVQITTRGSSVDNRSRLWTFSLKLHPKYNQTFRGVRMAPSRCLFKECA